MTIRHRRRGEPRAEADPTPEEIRAACLLIQSEWSDAERRRRVVGPRHDTVTVPRVRSMVATPRED